MFYDGFGESVPYLRGQIYAPSSYACYFMAISLPIAEMLGVTISIELMLMFDVCCSLLGVLFLKKKLYVQLKKKYQHETHRKLKGWLVVLYMIGSVLSLVTAMAMTDYGI